MRTSIRLLRPLAYRIQYTSPKFEFWDAKSMPMDAIIVRCGHCKHAMKFSAAKAGKKAKCTKCDAIVVVKAEEKEKKKDPARKVVTNTRAPREAPATAAPVVTAAPPD